MYLIFISKTKLEVFKNKQKVFESQWTSESLAQIFSYLKKTFSSRFRILVSDEFVTTTSFLINSQDAKKRNLVQQKAQGLIEANLSQTVWDYKVITRQNNAKLVQVIAVSKTFFDQLRSVSCTTKIKIELLQSFSTGLSQYLPKKELILIIYQDLLVVSFNQNPIYSQIIGKSLSQKEIESAFTFCQEKLKNNPQKIFFAPVGEIDFNQYDFHGLKPEYTNINPLESLISPKDLDGPDASVSKLEINPSSPISKFPKILLIIPVLTLLAILFIIFSDQILPSKNKNNQINPAISITPTAIPTAVPLGVKSFKIEILNGTGTSGQAAEVTELLSKNNFVVAKAGNAANYKFTQTQVQVKSSVNQNVIDLLIKSLGSQYSPKISTTKLNDSGDYDIIITTGN
jgi:hypothetical protein